MICQYHCLQPLAGGRACTAVSTRTDKATGLLDVSPACCSLGKDEGGCVKSMLCRRWLFSHNDLDHLSGVWPTACDSPTQSRIASLSSLRIFLTSMMIMQASQAPVNLTYSA